MKTYEAKNICLYILVLSLFGCRTPGSVVSGELERTGPTREALGDLSEQQAELGITGTRIEDESRILEQGLATLELSIKDGTDDNGEFTEILRSIRDRPVPDPLTERRRNRANQ